MFGWFKSGLLGLVTALVLAYSITMMLVSKPFEMELPPSFLVKFLLWGGLFGLALALFFHWLMVRKARIS